MNLDHLQTLIEIHLEKIEKILGPNYKLTLIASHNGAGDLKDADLVLTMADRAAVMKALNRFLPENSQAQSSAGLTDATCSKSTHG